MKNSLIGENVKIYGAVDIGYGVIIEDNVVIGHPAPAELERVRGDLEHFSSLDELYGSVASQLTILGNHSIVRSGTVIYSGCKIGERFDCGHHVVIRENSLIGNNVYVKPYTYIMSSVTIGNDCRLAGSIADFSNLGDNISSFGVLTHKRIRRCSEFREESPKIPCDFHGPVVENNCVIGRNAVVVGNIRLCHDSIIGANTFVNFDVLPNSKILGHKGRYHGLSDNESNEAGELD
jgi:serine acetyltransferase